MGKAKKKGGGDAGKVLNILLKFLLQDWGLIFHIYWGLEGFYNSLTEILL